MEIIITGNRKDSGLRAAKSGAELIRQAIRAKGKANIVLATGASQFDMLSALVREDIDWSAVSAFHLDEYIGLPETHPASFRKYLKERFYNIVSPAEFFFINGNAEPSAECKRLGLIIASRTIDVSFIGIGENGHIAFNDPPADFETIDPYIVVMLDTRCRQQQLGEGWFSDLSEVPSAAISMSVNQILKSENIICTVPDLRKAEAVRGTVQDDISPMIPASVLRKHPSIKLYLDSDSSSML